MTTPTTTAYYSADPLGTVTALSGSGGTQLGQYDNQPFGDGATSNNVDPSVAGDPFSFAGESKDPTTALYNLHARQYDPATGRFLSIDPVDPQPNSNSYAYVGGNPLGFTDPSGMKRRMCGSFLCYLGTGGPVGNPPPTIGGRATGTAAIPFIHVAGVAALCLVVSNGCGKGLHVGGTLSAGGVATSGAGLSGSAGFLGSTACEPKNLGGPFIECGASGGDGAAGTVVVSEGGGVTSSYAGAGAGAGISAFCGATDTRTW